MVKIVNWKISACTDHSQNKSNELSAEMTNAESSLMLPSSLQEDMVVTVGSSL